MIALKCPHCQAGIRGEDRFAGRLVTCPKCKKQVQMPTAPEPNVGASPGVQSPRSVPALHQRPVSQANAQAVMNNPDASDTDDGMSRQMKIALIALAAVAVLIAVTVIWSYEKSRKEAHRQEVQQVIAKNKIPEAVEKLKAYLSDENTTKTAEAKKLLAEIELATSSQLASSTLDGLGEEDFQRFQQSRHYSDARIAHPTLVKLWDSTLVSALPAAEKKREEANAKRRAELQKEQAEREAAAAKKAMKALPPEARFKKFVAKVRDELPKNIYFREGVEKGEISGLKFSYDVQKTDSLVSPLAATLQLGWRKTDGEYKWDYEVACNYAFQGGQWVFRNHTVSVENCAKPPLDLISGNATLDADYIARSRRIVNSAAQRFADSMQKYLSGNKILESSDQF